MSTTNRMTIEIGAKDMASRVLRTFRGTLHEVFVVAAGNMVASGVKRMLEGLGEWISDAIGAEQANMRLDAALRGLGSYTPQLAQRYRDLAEALHNETGASHENLKQMIAMLATLGVAPEKMAEAGRAVKALESLNRDGALAMVAVARAMEGDLTAFERFAPEVREAHTIMEKVAAANRLIAAGYQQQRDRLQTVGGAWAELKERMADARKDIILSVLEGSKLGQTLNEMQVRLGELLASEGFEGFKENIKETAAYARDIMVALTTKGGFTQTASALGDVILSALMDGADYLGKKISNAFGNKLDSFDPRLAGASRFWGARAGGASVADSVDAMSRGRNDSENSFTRTKEARDRLTKAIEDTAKQAEKEPEISEEITRQELARADELHRQWLHRHDKEKFVDEKLVQARADRAKAEDDMTKAAKREAELTKDIADAREREAMESARTRADLAKSRADSLWAEYTDPELRAKNEEARTRRAEAEAEFARRSSALTRKLESYSTFGHKLTGEEQRVKDLMDARSEQQAAQSALEKIEANTSGLAKKLSELVALKGG